MVPKFLSLHEPRCFHPISSDSQDCTDDGYFLSRAPHPGKELPGRQERRNHLAGVRLQQPKYRKRIECQPGDWPLVREGTEKEMKVLVLANSDRTAKNKSCTTGCPVLQLLCRIQIYKIPKYRLQNFQLLEALGQLLDGKSTCSLV